MVLFTVLLNLSDDDHQNFILDLYNQYNKLIHSIALNYIHNNQDADDILNSVMVKVIKHIHVFEGCSEKELISLIVTYSRSTANDYYRKNKRIIEKESKIGIINDDDDKISNDIIDRSMDVENIVITNEIIETVKKALLELSQTDQEIIKLRLLQEHNSKEIAYILNISVNAADLRYKNARGRLLRLIESK